MRTRLAGALALMIGATLLVGGVAAAKGPVSVVAPSVPASTSGPCNPLNFGCTVFGASAFGFRAANSGATGYGVIALTVGNTGTSGVFGQGTSADSNGVIGVANNGASAFGVWGLSTSGYAGYFSGNVQVAGNLSVTGAKSFVIDHPLDPANKYLYHAAVEAPDMMNLYTGIVALDKKGTAWVELPSYFEALNKDFRYTLTAVGAPGPNLYIVQEIKGNRFRIAGGTGGMKVSWMVTGTRNDPYAQAHPMKAEVAKSSAERGTYLYPEGYGQSKMKGVTYQKEQQALAAASVATAGIDKATLEKVKNARQPNSADAGSNKQAPDMSKDIP